MSLASFAYIVEAHQAGTRSGHTGLGDDATLVVNLESDVDCVGYSARSGHIVPHVDGLREVSIQKHIFYVHTVGRLPVYRHSGSQKVASSGRTSLSHPVTLQQL